MDFWGFGKACLCVKRLGRIYLAALARYFLLGQKNKEAHVFPWPRVRKQNAAFIPKPNYIRNEI